MSYDMKIVSLEYSPCYEIIAKGYEINYLSWIKMKQIGYSDHFKVEIPYWNPWDSGRGDVTSHRGI